MRKALIIGINYYEQENYLYDCVSNAYRINELLSNNSDGTKNFDTSMVASSDSSMLISCAQLKESVQELFRNDNEVSLFYFSGYGYIQTLDGYLKTSECSSGRNGFSMEELLKIANCSKAKNKIIILDTCYSDTIRNVEIDTNMSIINEGITILIASQKSDFINHGDKQMFSKLLVDALDGSAANLQGDISLSSLYAYIDESLGAEVQRPMLITNNKNFVSLRNTRCLDSVELQSEHESESESISPMTENREKFQFYKQIKK